MRIKVWVFFNSHSYNIFSMNLTYPWYKLVLARWSIFLLSKGWSCLSFIIKLWLSWGRYYIYGCILLPPAWKINYVNMQHNYIHIQHDYANMLGEYVHTLTLKLCCMSAWLNYVACTLTELCHMLAWLRRMLS